MIQISTILKVVDNSGARFVTCINLPSEGVRLGAFPGTVLKAAVNRVSIRKGLKKSRLIKQGSLCSALVVRTVYGFRRWGIFYFKTKSNSAIVVNKYLMPLGTRLFGPVFREVREKKLFKVIAKSEVAL